ncbi:MAG: hypothetical protein PS018_11470 [bacterium]|nr:hypothetical protein [bacterium]
MPLTNQTDDIEELESSTSQNPDAALETIGNDVDGAVAESSAAQTDDNDEGLLGVVRDVVKDRVEPEAAASSADGTEPALGPDGKPLPTGPDDENFSDVPFHKHPRFQTLVRQRDSFREDAGRFNNIQSYLDENNLTSEEAANALHTFARAKIDAPGAFAELKPWLQDLLTRAGEVMPEDIKARVDKGEITVDIGMELARERAKATSHEARQGFEDQRRQRQTTTAAVQELVSTAMAWESDRKAKDPNFEAKYPLLQREVAYLQQTEGKPKDKAGVQAQLKKAYDAVNKTFKAPAAVPSPQQKRPAIKPVTGGTVTGSAQREKPQNTLDIVRANRRQATG